MAVKIIQAYEMRAGVPIDTRLVVQVLTDIPIYALYEGLLVFQRSNKKFYKYVNGAFSSLSEAMGVASFNERSGNVSIIVLTVQLFSDTYTL